MKKVDAEAVFARIQAKIKSYLRLGLVLLMVLLALSFIKNINRIRDAKKQISLKEERVEKLRRENEEIQKRLEEVSTEVYVEKQLRDSLGLAKKDELVVILPEDDVLKSLAPKLEQEEEYLPDPNWTKWIRMFL